MPRLSRGSAGRRRSFLKWGFSAVAFALAIAGLVFPAIWMNTLTLDSTSSLPKKPDVPINGQGGVLLDAENRARLIEGLERRVFPSRTEKP